jgi:hypothetical protein
MHSGRDNNGEFRFFGVYSLCFIPLNSQEISVITMSNGNRACLSWIRACLIEYLSPERSILTKNVVCLEIDTPVISVAKVGLLNVITFL